MEIHRRPSHTPNRSCGSVKCEQAAGQEDAARQLVRAECQIRRRGWTISFAYPSSASALGVAAIPGGWRRGRRRRGVNGIVRPNSARNRIQAAAGRGGRGGGRLSLIDGRDAQAGLEDLHGSVSSCAQALGTLFAAVCRAARVAAWRSVR